MEVTKWLKPSNSGHNWWPRECAGCNASERRAILEKVDVQADPTAVSGKADTVPAKSVDALGAADGPGDRDLENDARLPAALRS